MRICAFLSSRFIGTKDVTDSAQTINQTGQQGKLYNTVSTLTYQFMPVDNGAQLKCEISHPALAGSLSSYAHLNVLCTFWYAWNHYTQYSTVYSKHQCVPFLIKQNPVQFTHRHNPEQWPQFPIRNVCLRTCGLNEIIPLCFFLFCRRADRQCGAGSRGRPAGGSGRDAVVLRDGQPAVHGQMVPKWRGTPDDQFHVIFPGEDHAWSQRQLHLHGP